MERNNNDRTSANFNNGSINASKKEGLKNNQNINNMSSILKDQSSIIDINE